MFEECEEYLGRCHICDENVMSCEDRLYFEDNLYHLECFEAEYTKREIIENAYEVTYG